MPAVGDILRRFRTLGVPGAPGPAGVPLDRSALLGAELAPVFRMLEVHEERAQAVIDQATRRASEIGARTAQDVGEILSRARAEAVGARASSVAVGAGEAERQCHALLDEAAVEVHRTSTVASARAPALAEEIVRRVLTMAQPERRVGAPDGPLSAPGDRGRQ